MSIRNKNDIRVYSELPFQINLIGQHREYTFPPCMNGEPTMNYVDWADIEYAHSRGNLFSAGLLVFDESEREEIYRELRINDWQKKVWYDKDIADAIENPTLEKMQRIIDVKDILTFERIRGKVVMYTNRGKDISQKVVNIVNQRYREINAGILGSKIVIRPSDVAKAVSVDEVEDLKRQLSQMKQLMEQMAANQATAVADKAEDKVVEETPVAPVAPETPVTEKKATPRKSTRKAATKK